MPTGLSAAGRSGVRAAAVWVTPAAARQTRMKARMRFPPEPDLTSSELRRFLFRADQLAVDQALRDLDRIERRALAQIVRHAPEGQSVLDRRILAHAADIGRVLAGAFVGRDVTARLVLVDHDAARRLAQDVVRLRNRDRLLELDIDGF